MALAPRAGRKPNTDSPQPLAEDRRLEQERREEAALLRDMDALLARYEKPLFNFVFQYLLDHAEAEDVTQETFIAAWKARDTFRGESKLNTWLYRIAQNQCKNRLKQRGRQREMEGYSLDAGLPGGDDDLAGTRDIADWSASPARVLEQKELGALINKAVDGLAPEYKVVLLLREMEGLAYTEIAQVTGLTMEAVKTRINRARAMVRQRVEPYLSP
ncbi:MAG: sigma-70 family RNA polymerase sigma factor [Armatimonadetes bacterium]|nr:sigma-70 family RNA polymerase sigma factor [Armatimonadota bacterium]